MTHVCMGPGTGEVRWRIHVDLGHGGTMFPREVFASTAEALADVERQQALPNAYREYRVVQVCTTETPGIYRICRGREAVQATGEKPSNPERSAGAGKSISVGKPPVGGDE